MTQPVYQSGIENDESYIAMRQREDAQARLKDVNSKSIKFIIARSLIVAAVVVGVIGLSMTTVNALAAAGKISSGFEIGKPSDEFEDFVSVIYMVDDETAGWIDGDTDQMVELGGSTTPVTAVPNDGWVFLEWAEDKSNLPERSETGVVGNMVFTATFVEMLDKSDGPGTPSDDPEDQEPSDEPAPKDENDDDPPPRQNDSNPNNPDPPPNANGKFQPSNKIRDTESPYQDFFEEDYEEAMKQLGNNSNLSDRAKSMWEAYWEQLKAGVDNSNSEDGK